MGARHPSITPFEAFATRDAHIVIAAGNDSLFAKLAAALGKPGLPADPRFATNPKRTEHHDALRLEIEAALIEDTTAAWLQRIDAAGVPCAPINNVAQAVSNPQIVARNMIVTATDAKAGPLKMAGNPIKLSGFPDPATRPPAPDLDADRAAILAELGLG
jgi:CoA:oxalate CoA-transferase